MYAGKDKDTARQSFGRVMELIPQSDKRRSAKEYLDLLKIAKVVGLWREPGEYLKREGIEGPGCRGFIGDALSCP